MANSQPALATRTAQRADLGNNTKSSPPPSDDAIHRARLNRIERYQLQSIARSIYAHEGRAKGLLHPFSYHRTAKCNHVRHKPNVELHLSKTSGKGFYGGLVQCGNVWTCPVCAAKVSERRRLEIAHGVDWAYQAGKKVVMVTFTFPHYSFQRVGDLLTKQRQAYTRLRKGRRWDKLKAKAGFAGLIRSLEVTYGENGFHPHTHELWIVDKDTDIEWMLGEILDLWWNACRLSGLVGEGSSRQVFNRRAVDIKDNCSTSDYLAKQDDSRHWGADREVAKASTKQGKASGVHPFQFLVRHDEAVAAGDKGEAARWAKLWVEYTKAFKGARQLFWSPGLKAKVGLQDLKDLEVVERHEDEADMLGLLSPSDWSVVIAYKGKAKILTLLEDSGYTAVRDWLDAREWFSEGRERPTGVESELSRGRLTLDY